MFTTPTNLGLCVRGPWSIIHIVHESITIRIKYILSILDALLNGDKIILTPPSVSKRLLISRASPHVTWTVRPRFTQHRSLPAVIKQPSQHTHHEFTRIPHGKNSKQTKFYAPTESQLTTMTTQGIDINVVVCQLLLQIPYFIV